MTTPLVSSLLNSNPNLRLQEIAAKCRNNQEDEGVIVMENRWSMSLTCRNPGWSGLDPPIIVNPKPLDPFTKTAVTKGPRTCAASSVNLSEVSEDGVWCFWWLFLPLLPLLLMLSVEVIEGVELPAAWRRAASSKSASVGGSYCVLWWMWST